MALFQIGPTSHTTDMLLSAAIISVIAGVVSGAPSASPVLSAVSDRARFSWEIPQGGLGTGNNFLNVSPAGTTVFIVFSSGSVIPTGSYTGRLVYQGNIAARNVTFTLSNIQTSDAGTYTCGNGGTADVIQNCGQKLVVLGKPTTPGRPVSTTPVYNQQVTLTCNSTSTTVPADHNLTLTYTWQRNNTDITVTSPGSPYIFTVSSRDSHSYRCRAIESQGLESEWSQGYNMEPQYGPYLISLTPSTSSYTVTEHQALPSITCSALCRPGCTYRWLHNGTGFSSGATLSLGQADRSKTGSYRCQPSNTHGSGDSVTVSVDVQYPANVSMFTANSGSGSLTVNESDPVTLRCQIDSNPRSVIRLLNGTEELTRADNSLTADFRVESADCRQRGNYSCTATNNIGAPVSQWMELLVKCSPRLDETLPQQLQYASRLGGNVNVTVSVLAFPLPTFTWSRTTSTSQDLTGSSSPVSDISVTARIHLTYLQQQDFGDYRLTVDNSEGGSVAYTLSIVSEGPPSTPTNVSVYTEGPFSLHVSWKEEFNGGATQTFTVEYSTDEEDWKTAGSHEETGRGNYVTSVIRDLNSGTVYYVRVVASNKFGNSTYTEHVTGRTEKKVEPPPSPAGLIAGVTIGVLLLAVVVVVVVVVMSRKGYTCICNCTLQKSGVNPYSGLQDRVDDKQTYTELKKYENTGFIHSKDSVNTYEELNRTSGQPYEHVKLATYVNADYTSKGMIKVETIILHM
ncbi:protein turtle homolog B-like [Haliotis cracherodii]|uniref:protein turtle homolog B-like n=1 Tax=Haliotis cracherodii TaxID=6455 RepID=UPI0039E78A68